MKGNNDAYVSSSFIPETIGLSITFYIMIIPDVYLHTKMIKKKSVLILENRLKTTEGNIYELYVTK